MKIKIFGKIVNFDEKNPGLKYFLDECCEFPTESWVIVQYSCMTHCKDEQKLIDELNKATLDEIKQVLKYGIFDTFNDAENSVGRKLDEERHYVELALK